MAAATRKRRRKLLALALVCAVIAAGLVLAVRVLLNGERLRRLAEFAVAKHAGVEMRIGNLEATLFPPRITATDITLAVPEATATVDRVVVDVNPARIFAREVSIPRGEISGLVLKFPDGPQAIPEIIDRVEKTVEESRGEGGAPVSVAIAEIVAAGHIYIGEDPAPFAVAEIGINDLLSTRIGIRAEAALRAWGDAAHLYGEVTLLRAGARAPEWQADGVARLSGIETARLPLTNPPAGVLAADVEFAPSDAGPGASVTARLDAPGRPEITGIVRAEGVWTGERAEVPRVLWETGGARLEGAGAIASLDDWYVTVREAHAGEAALDALLALLERPRARFEADSGAQVWLANFEADSDGGEWRIARGDLDFMGITIVSQVGGPAREGVAHAMRSLRGTLSAADGVITLREIHSDDLQLAGTLSPNRAGDALHVDLRGEINLEHMPWAFLDERGTVERVQGTLAMTRFAGTFARGEGVPKDLAIEGELRDAALRYVDPDVLVELRDAAGSLATDGATIAVNFQAFDAAGAPISLAGNYEVEARRWAGTLEADVASALPSLFVESDYFQHLRALAHTVGAANFDVEIEFPSAAHEQLLAELTRRDDSEHDLTARLAFDDRITAFAVEATLPARRILEEYLPKLRGEGPVRAGFAYDGSANTFVINVDATQCAIVSDTIVQKPAGTELRFTSGGSAVGAWGVQSFELRVNDTLALASTGPVRDAFIPFEARLQPLAALLTEGATAAGVVRGTLRLDPLDGDLQFDNAAIALTPQVALDRIHGSVRFTPETFACDALELRGARSDGSLTIARADGRWNGAATGTKLDVEAVVELAEAAIALHPGKDSEEAADAPPGLWTEPVIGEFTVDLGEAYYRRGRLDAVTFRVLGEDRAIRVTEFSARTGEGSLLGSLVVLPDDSTGSVVKSAVKWTDFDGRVLNDMLFADDRGFFGIFDGELTFDAPLGDYKTMLAGGGGSATWSARDGSLGEIGFASKLLTALRATEVITLKVPALRDQGLTYKTWNGGITMNNGVMTLKGTQLDGGAYAVTGVGSVDFAAKKTDVETFTRVLESVGKVVGSVPIIGGIITAVSTDLVGVPVKFSGSPYDLKVDVMKATGKSVATTPLRAGEGAIKAVGESLKKLIPGGGETKEEKEQKEEKEPSPPQ